MRFVQIVLFAAQVLCVVSSGDATAQRADVSPTPDFRLEVVVEGVEASIRGKLTGSKETKTTSIRQAIDTSRTSQTDTLKITGKKEEIRKLSLAATAGMGTGKGMGMNASASASANLNTTETRSRESTALSEHFAEDEKKRTDTLTSIQENKISIDDSSGFLELSLVIRNPTLATLRALIRLNVLAQDESGRVFSVADVYVSDSGTLTALGEITKADKWLEVPPALQEGLRKTVSIPISAGRVTEWLEQRLTFSGEVTNVILATTDEPAVTERLMDARARQIAAGKAFIRVLPPFEDPKTYPVDARNKITLVEALRAIDANVQIGSEGQERYVAKLSGIESKVKPGATLAMLLGMPKSEGAWFTAATRKEAANLDEVLRAGDDVTVGYVSQRDLIAGYSQQSSSIERLQTQCRQVPTAYPIAEAVMSSGTLLVIKLSGKRYEYMSDQISTTDPQRVTDITYRSITNNGDKKAYTRAPSRTWEVIDAKAWSEMQILFKLDDSNDRMLDELHATRVTTANLDHIVQVRLPEDFFESSRTRKLMLSIVPKAASLVIGREQVFTDPGGSRFIGYSENKETIRLTAEWKGKFPLRTFPGMQREHVLTARSYATTPGDRLTSESFALVGLSSVAPARPEWCPSGPLRKQYAGGCASGTQPVPARSLTPGEPYLKFLPAASVPAVFPIDGQPISRDADAERYCNYDGK